MAQRYHWRCSKETCKARYKGALHPDEYKRKWKCKACGGERFRMIANLQKDSCNILCNCGAYARWQDEHSSGPAPHRRGSRACAYNKDGTMRQIVRRHEDRLHPQAHRMMAGHDRNGPVFWLYDGEAEYEATWASEPDTCIAQFGGVQILLELQAASARRGQPCSAEDMAQWVDGATRARDAFLGQFRTHPQSLRRSSKTYVAHGNRARR